MDSVKSNLLFSDAGCRISEAYIFRLFTKSLSGHPMHIEAIVNLLTLFLDRIIPWRLPELRAHTYTFANILQLPFFESTEGRK